RRIDQPADRWFDVSSCRLDHVRRWRAGSALGDPALPPSVVGWASAHRLPSFTSRKEERWAKAHPTAGRASALIERLVPALEARLHLFEQRRVVATDRDRADLLAGADGVDNRAILATEYLTEYGVLAVEPRRRHVGN